ncbi:hypothetical protein DJ568_01325 [Mucilaginibacter hurinus]|uniref:DUF6089 domain-containing protein n=1 Tax=Mucilaginibacter hurinus TaxID=2201324 RepID=A0A367GSY4_9SPHI|nr:DUF6089 family protein [Mucilaginibacter hurinus]RCH56527.1 hypothetical protein DJ568_01325 [Mucilaginibacter hurinus]
MPKFLLTVFFLLASIGLRAQTWEIGLSGGGAGYMGDLNQHNPFQLSGGTFGGFIKRNFNGYLSIKGALSYGRIGAADSNSNNQQFRDRNLSFYNRLKEASLVGEFNFLHYVPDAGKNWWTPFVYAGIAITEHAPRTIYRGTAYGLRPLKTEGQDSPYANSFIAVPYGAGIKYNIGGKWTLIADLGYRYAMTDYIDDVSGLYPEVDKLASGDRRSIAIALSDRSGEKTGTFIGLPNTQRGDLRKRDQYLFLNLSISFTFVTERCYYEQSR